MKRGFFFNDVKTLLEDAGIPDQLETIAEWYDGYIFGRESQILEATLSFYHEYHEYSYPNLTSTIETDRDLPVFPGFSRSGFYLIVFILYHYAIILPPYRKH